MDKLIFTITDAGRQAIINASNTGTEKVEIKSVGIGSSYYITSPEQTDIHDEIKRITSIGGAVISPDTIHVSAKDDSPDEYVVHTVGLYTDKNILFAVYSRRMPIINKSSATVMLISSDITFKSLDTANITFGDVVFINPPASESVVGGSRFATAEEVEEGLDPAIAVSAKRLKGELDKKANLDSPNLTGTPTAPTTAESDNSQKIATTAFIKQVLLAYAKLASPNFTGKPTAPTADQSSNDTQLATTAFVRSAIAALVDSSPGALDTLNELAAALGDDPNFATTMTNALAGKQPLDGTLTNLSGKDVPALLQYLGLEETINLVKNAVPATRRVNSKPLTGDITLWASDVGAISAGAVGKITDNGTMASANTPGWWRVEVSNSDTVADFPTYPDGSKLYSYGYLFVEKIGEVWFQHYYAHMGANAKRQDWGTVPNTSRPWIVDYNTANKPTANDVQALPIAGGRLNGPLSIGTDNALGGNSIVLGDNDTGFKQNGDGVLDVYSNYTHVLRFIGNLVESMVSLKVNGNAVATGEVQAGNGTSRMAGNGDIFGNVWNGWLSTHLNNNLVADVQLGAGTSVVTWNNAGSWPNTPGYVVTSVWKDNQGENIDGIAYAPLQKRLGIQWYTVQGGTA
ncbi:TPA: phage tail protein [Salmonella enterica]|uniref:phage tail protein n=1 Tax=Salmonella sp. SG203 TaxID=2555397 RepID=UPI0020C64CFA|nr:phage tail protein [Salmonella sp. SG203]